MKQQEQETITNQITCPNCNSRRVQLLQIAQTDEQSILDLLCLECGTLLNLNLTGAMQLNLRAEPKQQIGNGSYVG